MTEKKTPGYFQGIEVLELIYGQSALQRVEGADRDYATFWCHMSGKLPDGQPIRVATFHESAVELVMQLRRALPETLKLPGISRFTPGHQTRRSLKDVKLFIDVAGLTTRKDKKTQDEIYVFQRYRPSAAPDNGYDEAKTAFFAKEREAFGSRAKGLEAEADADVSDQDVDAMMNAMGDKDEPAAKETAAATTEAPKEETQKAEAPKEEAPKEDAPKEETQEAAPEAKQDDAPATEEAQKEEASKEEASKEAAEPEAPASDETKEFGNEAETEADYTETTLGLNEEQPETTSEDQTPAQDESKDEAPKQTSAPAAAGGLRRRRVAGSAPSAPQTNASSAAPKDEAPKEQPKPQTPASPAGAQSAGAGTLGRRRLAGGSGQSQPATTQANDKPAEKAADKAPAATEQKTENRPAPSTPAPGGLRRRRVVAPTPPGPR